MPLPANLGASKPLGQVVDHLDELPSWSWLFVPATTPEITLTLQCYPSEIDSREVSEDEIEAFEAAMKTAGFNCFLCRDQLQDIIDNLQQQRSDFARIDVERAIDFYWRHDAYIELADDVA